MTRLDKKNHQWRKSQGRNRKWLADRECAEKRNLVEKWSFPNGFLKIEGDFSAVRMVRCLASGYSIFFCSRNHWSKSSSESFFATVAHDLAKNVFEIFSGIDSKASPGLDQGKEYASCFSSSFASKEHPIFLQCRKNSLGEVLL